MGANDERLTLYCSMGRRGKWEGRFFKKNFYPACTSSVFVGVHSMLRLAIAVQGKAVQANAILAPSDRVGRMRTVAASQPGLWIQTSVFQKLPLPPPVLATARR